MLLNPFQAGIHPGATSLLGHFFGLLFFGPTKKSDLGAGRRTKRPLRKRQPSDTPIKNNLVPFSLGQQRKATRASAEARNARCAGGNLATSPKQEPRPLDSGLRRNDEVEAQSQARKKYKNTPKVPKHPADTHPKSCANPRCSAPQNPGAQRDHPAN
jgi:hypothetical protein